jgi:hypothetical protein
MTETAADPGARRWSLRLRVGGWTVVVFTLALTLFTIVGILEDRRQILRAQAEQGRALLTHLSLMGEFRGDVPTANSHLALLRDSLVGTGGSLELVPATKEAKNGLVARQLLPLAEGSFELRYVGDVTRLRELTRRSVLLHVAHGVVTLAILLAGMEWILRRNLIAPLRSLSREVDRMRHGGGWAPVIPPIDVELGGLAEAVKGLGPALEGQVHQWVNAERHAAVTLALSHIRAGLAGPLRDIRGFIGDLEERHLIAPTGKPKLRSILRNLDLIREALQIEENVELAYSRWRGPTPTDESSGRREEKKDSR